MWFCGKKAITTHAKCKGRGVLENTGYLLQVWHWDFKNWGRIDWENEANEVANTPSKNGYM